MAKLFAFRDQLTADARFRESDPLNVGAISLTLAKHELLLPREHGAYAEVVFPVLTGLTLGSTSPAAICFAIAAVAFFLAHEPIAVIMGRRGGRAMVAWGGKARGRIVSLASLGTTCGIAAMVFASREGRLAALAPLVGGAILLPAFLSGRLKTLAAEILVIAALSSMVLPMAVSNGVERPMAWTAAGVWFVVFSLGTLGVHVIKAKAKKTTDGGWTIVVTPLLGTATVLASLWTAGTGALPLPVALALVLGGAAAIGFSVIPIHPRRLKTVGWTLVTANVATWVLLLLAD